MTSAQLPCPTCGRLSPISNAKHLPFCSERCRLIDLGRWLDEENALPTAPADDEPTDASIEADADQPQRSSDGSKGKELKPGGISYKEPKPAGVSRKEELKPAGISDEERRKLGVYFSHEEERKPVKLPPGWHDA